MFATASIVQKCRYILAEKSALIHTQTVHPSLVVSMRLNRSSSWFAVLVPPLGSASHRGAGWPLAGRHKGASLGSTWSPGAPARSWANPRCHARRVASAHFTVFCEMPPPRPITPLRHLSQAPVTSLRHRTPRLGSWNKTIWSDVYELFSVVFNGVCRADVNEISFSFFFFRKGVIHSEGFSFLMLRGGKQANDYF